MRIRLLFTLALFLSTGATPLHASLGPAPQCLPLASQRVETDAAKSHLTAGVIPNYDAEDRDYMIRTIVFEADGEPDEGKIAVAYIILNRVKSGGWGLALRTWWLVPGNLSPG